MNEKSKKFLLPIILFIVSYSVYSINLDQQGIFIDEVFHHGFSIMYYDSIKNGDIQLVINTPLGAQSRYDEYQIGRASIRYKITVITTISGAQAAVRGIRNIKSGSIEYRSLQEVFC